MTRSNDGSKIKYQAAQVLIQEGEAQVARLVLETIAHPKAQALLTQLPHHNVTRTRTVMSLVVLTILLAVFGVGFAGGMLVNSQPDPTPSIGEQIEVTPSPIAAEIASTATSEMSEYAATVDQMQAQVDAAYATSQAYSSQLRLTATAQAGG